MSAAGITGSETPESSAATLTIDAGGSDEGSNKLNPVSTCVGLATVVISLQGLLASC